MGATGFGYDLARQFGHTVIEPRPALVPLVLHPEDLGDWTDLSGVSAEVVAQAHPRNSGHLAGNRARTARAPKLRPTPAFREKLLITHRGISGPAVLQISSYWQPGSDIQVDLAPTHRVFESLKERSSGRDRNAALASLKAVLPARLAERWLDVQLQSHADWSNTGLDRLENALHQWTLRPAGTEGFAKAEVTAGGVDTRELDARTLESLRVPGLHFIGEVVDVTGWLGGYNFQWAWASAAACGRSL